MEVFVKVKLIKKLWDQIYWTLGRIWFELLILVSLIGIILISPYSQEGRVFLLNTFIGKAFLVSCGILHAHISRKLIFPYIDFNDKKTLWAQNIMVIIWYAIIITAWARGG